MKNAAIALIGSKKAIVYVITIATIAAVIFGGVDPAHAMDFVDKITLLGMAYLGGQGLADLGKHAGEAYASGKRAISERNADGDRTARLESAVEAGLAAGEAIESALAKEPSPADESSTV